MASILFRKSEDEREEFDVCCSIFEQTYESRMQLPRDTTVVGRYSVLPFYRELERDLALINSKLINSYDQHNYIATMEWYWDIERYTPKTLFPGSWHTVDKDKPYVVKGLTNSRKFMWKTHMFAENGVKVFDVIRRLMDDTMIREQGIVIREYAPLKKLGELINGLPITNEWRVFCLYGKPICAGFYWTNWEEAKESESQFGNIPEQAMSLVRTICDIVHVPFFACDVAETEDGSWTVVELNDGQMSGLSCNNPVEFYTQLKRGLNDNR